MEPRLTDKALREMDERFKLQGEGLDILKTVVGEWDTDPMSVQCFDLRIVERAKEIIARLKEIDPFF